MGTVHRIRTRNRSHFTSLTFHTLRRSLSSIRYYNYDGALYCAIDTLEPRVSKGHVEKLEIINQLIYSWIVRSILYLNTFFRRKNRNFNLTVGLYVIGRLLFNVLRYLESHLITKQVLRAPYSFLCSNREQRKCKDTDEFYCSPRAWRNQSSRAAFISVVLMAL